MPSCFGRYTGRSRLSLEKGKDKRWTEQRGIKTVLVKMKRDVLVIATVKPPNSLLTNKWVDVVIGKTSEI